MARSAGDGALEEFSDRLRNEMAPYAGLVEYGNLRSQFSDWENAAGGRITNIALVYETPGGSTDQINVSFDHTSSHFSVVDDVEVVTPDAAQVLERILPRIHSIPGKRFEALTGEIRRQIDEGVGRAGLFGHINRLTQSDFKGGTITHQELKNAMQFAIRYLREKDGGAP